MSSKMLSSNSQNSINNKKKKKSSGNGMLSLFETGLCHTTFHSLENVRNEDSFLRDSGSSMETSAKKACEVPTDYWNSSRSVSTSTNEFSHNTLKGYYSYPGENHLPYYLCGEDDDFESDVAACTCPPKDICFTEPPTGKTEKLRKAQLYLQNHQIFELFRFFSSHLLSNGSEDNPIERLLDLLDKIMLYKKGLCLPPLLYEKKHIEELFDLMDPLKTGVVELQQYNKAMANFGIGRYNLSPRRTIKGMVSRETFVKEVYEAELNTFHVMICIRDTPNPLYPKPCVVPPPTVGSITSLDSEKSIRTKSKYKSSKHDEPVNFYQKLHFDLKVDVLNETKEEDHPIYFYRKSLSDIKKDKLGKHGEEKSIIFFRKSNCDIKMAKLPKNR